MMMMSQRLEISLKFGLHNHLEVVIVSGPALIEISWLHFITSMLKYNNYRYLLSEWDEAINFFSISSNHTHIQEYNPGSRVTVLVAIVVMSWPQQ